MTGARADAAQDYDAAMLIPLIVACALFMENLDSTVLATSLPAIARRLWREPGPAQLRDHQLPVQPRRVHPDQRLGGRPLRRPATCSAAPSSCS